MIRSAKLACGGAVALMLLGGMICPAMAETNTDSAYGRVEQRIIENNPDFDIQLDAAEELYGIQIGFQFTFKDIQIYLQKNSENYPREVIRRVEQLLRRQMRKYGYLMKK